jgi:DNA-directed RNA polymerase subunit RPC12/RpoP
MKPRTQYQKEVAELSKTLRPLDRTTAEWAKRVVPYFVGHLHNNGKITCMRCGTKFNARQAKDTRNRCPHCHTILHIRQTNSYKDRDTECFAVLGKKKDWLVMRYFHVITETYHSGKDTSQYIVEVMQRWLDKDGHYVVRARQRGLGGNGFAYGSPMEVRVIRRTYYHYNELDRETYCKLKIKTLPKFVQYYHYDKNSAVLPFDFYMYMVRQPYLETLYKQHRAIFDYITQHEVYKHDVAMKAIKVALRHKYPIEKDINLWVDYVYYLQKLKRDTNNPFFICPKDLRKAHDEARERFLKEDRERRERQLHEQRIKEALQQEKADKEYQKRVGCFVDYEIRKGNISIHVLHNIAEFVAEANALHHCVFDMKYYARPQSLILDASVNGERTETIEINKSNFSIVQVRGKYNQDSPYHKQIVELITDNIENIRRIAESA